MLLKTCKDCGEPLLGTELDDGICWKCLSKSKNKNKRKNKNKNKRKIETLTCQCRNEFDPSVETGRCKDCDSYICNECEKTLTRCASCALAEATLRLEDSIRVLSRTILIKEELLKVGLCENCFEKLFTFVGKHKK